MCILWWHIESLRDDPVMLTRPYIKGSWTKVCPSVIRWFASSLTAKKHYCILRSGEHILLLYIPLPRWEDNIIEA